MSVSTLQFRVPKISLEPVSRTLSNMHGHYAGHWDKLKTRLDFVDLDLTFKTTEGFKFVKFSLKMKPWELLA